MNYATMMEALDFLVMLFGIFCICGAAAGVYMLIEPVLIRWENIRQAGARAGTRRAVQRATPKPYDWPERFNHP